MHCVGDADAARAGDGAARSHRGPFVLAGLLAAIATAMVVLAPAATAHAVFVSASPAPGASLTSPPRRLRIVFSEPLVAKLSSVMVRTSSGTPLRPRTARVDPSDRSAYEQRLPRLKPDRYTVIWHTTSQIDGHSRRGSYTFTVLEPDGTPPPVAAHAPGPPAEPTPLPTQVQAATSWAGLAGLFLVAGTALTLLLGGIERAASQRLFGRLLVIAAAGTLLGVAGQFAATWSGTGWRSSTLTSVLGDGIAGWLWLRVGATAAVLALWPWGGRVAGTVRRSGLVAATLAMVVSFAASGHGAASSRPNAGLALMSVHVLAASVWLGGALGLATVWALARRHGTSAVGRRTLLRRFSLVAGMAVPAVAASGAASAVLELGSITDFIRSEYAITLLAKLAIAAAIGVVALSNVLLHRRGPVTDPARGHRVRAGLWTEAALGLAILVPTATMSVLAPSVDVDAARQAAHELKANPDPAAAFTGTATLGTRGLELSLTHGTVGTNAVRAELDGTDAATRLRLRLSRAGHSISTELRRTGHDHDPATHTIYQGSITVETAGTWSAVVRGPRATSAPITMPLHPAPPGTRPASASPADLDGWLVVIAVLGAAGVIVGATRFVGTRRWRTASLTLGGACAVSALAGVTVLSVVAGSATATTVASSWGVAHRVSPTTAHGATTWTFGGLDAGQMMPAVGPDGSVWVGEMDTNKLARLDPDRNIAQEIALPGGYKEIMGVAVDEDNHVWICDEHAQALGMFDPSTGRYRQFAIPGHDPAPLGIAVDAKGRVWFTMMNGNGVGRFDPGTGEFTEYRIPTEHALPYWVSVGPHGQVWFSEFGAGKLGVLHPASGAIQEYSLPHGSSPAGIAVGRHGVVWATTTQGLLVELDPHTGRLRTFGAPVADEYGVTVGASGHVWFGTASGRAVYSFDPATTAFTRHRLPPRSNPWWVTAGAGHVWVALSSRGRGGLSELDAVS